MRWSRPPKFGGVGPVGDLLLEIACDGVHRRGSGKSYREADRLAALENLVT